MIYDRNPTRRELLSGLGALGIASSALVTSGCANRAIPAARVGADVSLAPAPGEEPSVGLSVTPERVIVIGAGIAGLAAAHALTLEGLPNVVLEARDRVGGRMHTVPVADAPVDVGAAWIHQPVGNPTSLLAAAAGLRTRDHGIESLLRASALLSENPEAVADARVGFWPRLRLFSSAAGVEPSFLGHGDSTESLDEAVAALVARQHGSPQHQRRLVELIDILFSTLFAAPLNELGAANLSVEEPYGGADDVVVGGYSALIKRLATGLSIRTGATVVRVQSDSTGVTVGLDDGTCERGSHVIVTLPVGVLQSGAMRFEPPLPDTQRLALQPLNAGRFEKVILRYQERWWSELGRGALRLGGAENDLPVWMDFSEPAGAPTLIALCAGGRVDSLHNGLKAGPIADLAEWSLRRMVGRKPPAPLAVHVTGWRDDPFTRGAYSSLRPGAPRRVALAVATPHADRVLFAGEHTSIDRGGTVDGALLSGVREACRVLGRKAVGLHPAGLPA